MIQFHINVNRIETFLLVGRFTSQCLFCPFWHFGPYWLSMKVLCWYVWCHIFAGDAFFVFALLYFNVVCFSCLSLSWYGMVIHFARELLAPSWCYALFLSYVMCTHDLWFVHGRGVLLFMWYICCLLLIMSGNGLWLWRLVLYAWHPIRWRLLPVLTFIYSLCTTIISLKSAM